MARPPWQAERQSRPPGKPRPIQVAAKCGVCIVALLGFVVLATTFVARLASIRILPATQFAEDSIRGSLTKRVPFGHTQICCIYGADRHRTLLGGLAIHQKPSLPELCLAIIQVFRRFRRGGNGVVRAREADPRYMMPAPAIPPARCAAVTQGGSPQAPAEGPWLGRLA